MSFNMNEIEKMYNIIPTDPATTTEYQFCMSPLKDRIHEWELKTNPFLRLAFTQNMTEYFFRDLRWRMENMKNVNILVKGEQGSGKSTISFILMHYLDYVNGKKTTVDNICMTREEFRERFLQLNEDPFGNTLTVDEDYDFLTQMGATRIREEVEYIEQVVRQLQLNIISCAVARVPRLFNYRIEAFDIDLKNEINRAILYGSRESHSVDMPLGILFFPRKSIPKDFIDEYTKKKLAFLERVQSGEYRQLIDFDSIADDIIKKYNLLEHPKVRERTVKIIIRNELKDITEGERKELVDTILYKIEMYSLHNEDKDKPRVYVKKKTGAETETPCVEE